MEPKDTAVKAKKAKHAGIDPRGVFAQLLHSEFDPGRVQVMDLIFATRPLKDGQTQVVSVLDGGDEEIKVYPVVSRFVPKPGHPIRCFVILRQAKRKVKGREVTITAGFAMPVNLRQAAREGIWLGLRNNILTVTSFRLNQDDRKTRHGNGPNGKVVLAADGFEVQLDTEVRVQVSERLSCYIAHALVPLEDLPVSDDGTKSTALVLQAETLGAVLDAVDAIGFTMAGRLYDACEELGVPATAAEDEIKAAYRNLAQTHHPDARTRDFRMLTSREPTDTDRQSFNFEWSIIEAAQARLMTLRQREAARKRYFASGRRALPTLTAQLSVSELAKALDKNTGMVKAAFRRAGYEGVEAKTMVSRDIAWIVAGILSSGAIDEVGEDTPPALPPPAAVDAAPAEAAPEPPAPVDPALQAALEQFEGVMADKGVRVVKRNGKKAASATIVATEPAQAPAPVEGTPASQAEAAPPAEAPPAE